MAKKTRKKSEGNALARLDATIHDANKLDAYVQVRLPRRKDPIEVMLSLSDQMVYVNAHGKATKTLKLPINLRGERDAAVSLMNELASQLARGKVDLESGVARSTDCSVDDKALARLVLAAWCDVFGNEVPSDNELQRVQQQQNQEEAQLFAQFVEDLRNRPPAGENKTLAEEDTAELQSWWERLQTVMHRARYRNLGSGLKGRPSLAGTNLSGANLKGINFGLFVMSRCKLRGADMRGCFSCADFTKADLRKANLCRAQLAHANFTDVNLSDSRLDEADCLGGQFIRTSLKKASLRGANFDRARFEDVIWDEAVFDEKTRWPVGFPISPNLVWAGEGEDPRESQPKKARKRRTPKRPTANLLLSDEQLASYIVGMEDDPKLPENIDIDFQDDSTLGRELQYSVLLEFLPHRLDDLNLSQIEIDFNTWYRCERFARLQDALQGGFSDGDHDRADRWSEMIFAEMNEAEFWELYQRIEREVRALVGE